MIEDIPRIMLSKAGHMKLNTLVMNLIKMTWTCINLKPMMMNYKVGKERRWKNKASS